MTSHGWPTGTMLGSVLILSVYPETPARSTVNDHAEVFEEILRDLAVPTGEVLIYLVRGDPDSEHDGVVMAPRSREVALFDLIV